MKWKWPSLSITILLALGCQVVWASGTGDKPDYRLLNRVVACQSIRCVVADLPMAKDKTERTVIYEKWLLLQPSSLDAAKGLLENIPTTDREVMLLFTLPDWHEGATTSEAQMESLDHLHTVWPRLLARAVQRLPGFLPAYIRYGLLAGDDIHSDYTGYEQEVCRSDSKRFEAAFLTLSTSDQAYIRKHVFNPSGCKPIFLSEAD
jgi:hypothetical protein